MSLEISRKGMLLVLSGPAGAGKGTLGKMLLRTDKNFYFSISATTRGPRFNETHGVDYHFLTDKEFDNLVDQNMFLEYATVHSHRYGTLKQPIVDNIEKGVDVLLDIDTQGAMNVIKAYPDCVSVFILPPSFEILEQRLHTRNTDNPDEIQKRLRNARKEIQLIDKYDYAIINNTVDLSFESLMHIVKAEKSKTKRFMPRFL
ncbi:MAG: guanylate kinase [Christensenellaceae bacterium]|nr:guanylate kinase [Christensenellaceae bacterium]